MARLVLFPVLPKLKTVIPGETNENEEFNKDFKDINQTDLTNEDLNEDILKVGLGLNDDLRRLRSDFHFLPAGFLDLQNYVTAYKIEEKGLKKLSGIVLGRRISKSHQVSNWDTDLLTEAQLRYAATDAWICLEIYNSLRNSLLTTNGRTN